MTAPGYDRRTMAALRSTLREAHPWLDDSDLGPRTVDAGECDRCGGEARMIATCGPVAWAALGRRCAMRLGTQAWCDGHVREAETWLVRLAGLPTTADTVARLWWVATGEVRVDPAAMRHLRQRALPDGGQ